MKILHYNIHMWTDAEGVNNADRVEALIRDQDPDLVSLVEVDEPWGQPSTLARIAERLGYHWAFVPAFEYRCEGGFGNAILSRTPLDSVQQWQLLPPSLYDGTEPSEPRAVILVSAQVGGAYITFGSTHLPRHDSTLRNQAARRLLDLLNRITTPWVICGDFNQPPEDWITVGCAYAPLPSEATYPVRNPVEHLDYAVFAGLELRAKALAGSASDHLPLLVVQSAPS